MTDGKLTASQIQSLALRAENQGDCVLWRSDTHGTETPVVKNVSAEFAQQVMESLESRPHHQGYWYGPMPR